MDNIFDNAAEVAAMQFAGGMPVERVAALWDRDEAWVLKSVRMALLGSIPKRDGGLKITRTEARAARRGVKREAGPEQAALEFAA